MQRRIYLGFCVCMAILSFSLPLIAQTGKPKVIAHRGAWKARDLPQNSIASLKEAIRLGCAGSEFDVWLTADDVVVVNHDPDYYGIPIETSSYQTLKARKHPNGEEIPTLEAYLEAGKGQKHTRLVLEIKTSRISKERTLKLTQACVEQVQASQVRDIVDYICFDYDAGLKVHAMDPEAEVAFLSADADAPDPKALEAAGYTGLDYQIKVIMAHPEWIQQARESGLTTNVWTVDKPEHMHWMIEAGLDYITTDEPEQLLSLLKQ